MNIFKLLPTYTRNFIVLTFTIVLFTACGDNPASSDEDHEHTEPVGLELVHDGEVIYEYFDGDLTEHSHLHYYVGEEYLFEVHFLNEDGEHVHAEDLEDYSLGWDIENEEVLEIYQQDEDGPWSFYLEGIAEGASKVQFKLMHGTHADFETLAENEEGAIEFHIDADGSGEHDH